MLKMPFKRKFDCYTYFWMTPLTKTQVFQVFMFNRWW